MSGLPTEVIEIRDPAVDIEAVMATIRERAAKRRAQASGLPDLDATTRAVFTEAGAMPAADVDARLAPSPAPPPGRSALPILGELNSQWMIREQPFVSHAPLVGPLIVKVREAWNWMSTKWYVRPLVQQITAFNLSVVRAFREVEDEQGRVADRVRELETLTQQQAAELAQLRQEVQRLRGEMRAELEAEEPRPRP